MKLKKKQATKPQQNYNFPYHNARVLQVLAEHADGLNKSELRARAFNRVPRSVSDQWLDVMESKGQIRSQYLPTGKKGRPGLVYRKAR